MEARYFTVAEARAALPEVRGHMEQILEARRAILELQPEVWPVIERAAGNGGAKVTGRLVELGTRLRDHLKRLLDMGVEVKDLSTGLVDFPHLREGREVYLCWQFGEEDLAFWHEVEAGFAGRQPL